MAQEPGMLPCTIRVHEPPPCKEGLHQQLSWVSCNAWHHVPPGGLNEDLAQALSENMKKAWAQVKEACGI